MVDTSWQIDQQIEAEVQSGAYTFEEPEVIMDPYQISPLTGVAVFQTDEEYRVRVTVKGKTKEADITGVTVKAKGHRVPIIGLYPKTENSVKLELLDDNDQTIKEMELKVQNQKLQQLHDNECSQNVTKQSHTQGQGLDEHLQDIDRCYDCDGFGKALDPSAHTFFADTCGFHQNDTHQGQCRRYVQILGRGLHTEQSNDIGYTQIQQYANQIRYIPFAFFSDHSRNNAFQLCHDRLCHQLSSADIVYFEVACKDNRQDQNDCHDHPGDNDRFRNVQLYSTDQG